MKHTLTFHTILLLALVAALATVVTARGAANRADVVIYGATPAGITAAIAADRAGASVVLLEHGTHIGGMMASGLGHTDVGDKRTIGGLAAAVFKRIGAKYGGGQTYYFQPHVGSAVFHEMLAESKVRLLTGRTLKSVTKDGVRPTALECTDGSRFEAGVFVDWMTDAKIAPCEALHLEVNPHDVVIVDVRADKPLVVFRNDEGPEPTASELERKSAALFAKLAQEKRK